MPRLGRILIVSILIVQGCAFSETARDSFAVVKHLTLGEYYLDARRYREGRDRFQEEVAARPADHRARYYLGRFQLAEGQVAEALTQLREAVRLAPDKADYLFWQGVAQGASGMPAEERRSYQRALALDPRHPQAHIYLGHNLFDARDYPQALEQYQQALALVPDNPQALYNRALTLRRLGRTPEEITAWRLYLAEYPTGAHARQATAYLNGHGVFDYRNYLIGRRTVTLPRIDFEPLSAALTPESRQSLAYLAGIVNRLPGWTLQVVVYQRNNAPLAEARARAIKANLLQQNPALARRPIRLSWFGVPQTITIGARKFTQEASVQMFTTNP